MTRRRKLSKGYDKTIRITLAGAPNVGKSTVFNALTGLRQHTGNWAGKTVESARGRFVSDGVLFEVTDIPGAYSLSARSAEEEVARRYIEENRDDVTAVVCDASGLERSLPLALNILSVAKRCVVFLNLCDEAEKAGIEVDARRLSELLGVAVVCGTARKKTGIAQLVTVCRNASETERTPGAHMSAREVISRADAICREVVTRKKEAQKYPSRADRILAGKMAYPVMAALLVLVFWLTLEGANYPSELIAKCAALLSGLLRSGLSSLGAPEFLVSFLVDGVYGTSAWIVSVMLPPMAIFFPLFTLLEDAGYLPRVAFCLDRACRGCGGCGKMALCMCEGLGCNAVGVTGSRIIDSRRERLLAALTNSFIPCNGRFPALIALISVFIAESGSVAAAAILASLVALSVASALGASRLLSQTILKGEPSSFALELTPYRRPKIGEVIVRSVFDRTLFVLGRALRVAAPAGGIIWILANVKIGGAPCITYISGALDPLGRFLGMDGAIILAFILGLPANEIILPLIVMIYLSSGTLPAIGDLSALREVFVSNGWTVTTAICTTLFFLFHSPCSTTLLTLRKETGSVKYTLVAAALPVALGVILCAAVNFFSSVFFA